MNAMSDNTVFHVKQPADIQHALGASDEQMARLDTYLALLEKWQRRINLVGGSTLDDAWTRHVLDSAQLMRYLPRSVADIHDRPTTVIVDLGSGAGFPGLVLAILGAGDVHLVESDGRKAAFLNEARRLTNAPATVHHERIEAYAGPRADVVTARALAPLADLLAYAEVVGHDNTRCLFLKGRQWAEELAQAKQNWQIDYQTHPGLADQAGTVIDIHAFTRR